jgi:adenylate kinase
MYIIMRPQTFIFFGKSGSGKGTQARLLGDYLKKIKSNKVLYIETGEGFRQFMETGSHTANLTKQVLADGGLMPVFMPIWLWTDFLVKNYNGTEDLILDGLCRRPAEAPVLDSALKFFGQKNPIIVYINVSNDWAFTRMKARGRKDDTDEYIKSRLEWFEWNVVPSMAYFHEHPDYTFLEINGEQTVEEVHNEIISRLATR